MRALCWHGKKDIRCDDVPDPADRASARRYRKSHDMRDLRLRPASLRRLRARHRCTATSSDMNSWAKSSRSAQRTGKLKVGDRVVVPFTICCGECEQCRRGNWSVCERTNRNHKIADNRCSAIPPRACSVIPHLTGGYAGGQAEYVRVPYADVGADQGPPRCPTSRRCSSATSFPTGWQAAMQCDIEPDDTVAIWGAGPVGQFGDRGRDPPRRAPGGGDRLRAGTAEHGRGPAADSDPFRGGKRDRAAQRPHRRPRPGEVHRRGRASKPTSPAEASRQLPNTTG